MLFDKTKEGRDPIYRKVCDSQEVEKINQKFEELWRKFKPYADKGFEQLFRDNVVSRFWEMYLGAFLIKKKKKLGEKNDEGPDICIIENDREKIWIEATATDKGEGNDKIEVKKCARVPEKDIILRIRSAIEVKHRKYVNYLEKGLIKKSDAYIIAINASKIGFPDSIIPISIDPPKILRAVFGVCEPYVQIESNKIVGQGFNHRERIFKKSGSPVEMDIFLNKKYDSISAIIYSDIGPFDYPYDLGSDIKLVHNPNAANPINRGWLMRGIGYYIESDLVKSTNWNK